MYTVRRGERSFTSFLKNIQYLHEGGGISGSRFNVRDGYLTIFDEATTLFDEATLF